MNFWDTVAGYHLAETLTRTLPEIARSMKPKKQVIERMPRNRVYLYLLEEQKAGRVLVNTIDEGEGWVVVVTQ